MSDPTGLLVTSASRTARRAAFARRNPYAADAQATEVGFGNRPALATLALAWEVAMLRRELGAVRRARAAEPAEPAEPVRRHVAGGLVRVRFRPSGVTGWTTTASGSADGWAPFWDDHGKDALVDPAELETVP